MDVNFTLLQVWFISYLYLKINSGPPFLQMQNKEGAKAVTTPDNVFPSICKLNVNWKDYH